MKQTEISTVLIIAIMATCALAPGIVTEDSSAAIVAGDWTASYGNLENPWVTAAESPTYDTPNLKSLWDVRCSLDTMSSGWKVPGTAIVIGNDAYYYDSYASKLMKVDVNTGKESASVSCTTDTMFNTPITYGNGKIFLPILNDVNITVNIYDASTLQKIGNTDRQIGNAQGMQGTIVYNDGYIYFGTHGSPKMDCIDFACFTETGSYVWGINGGGWYNAVPAFVTQGGTTYCIVANKGYTNDVNGNPIYTTGGSTLYVRNATTGDEIGTVQLSMEFVNSGITYYEERVYVATSHNKDATGIKTSLHSFTISDLLDGGDTPSEKTWTSSMSGGCQSQPVIYNDRIYLGSGGEVSAATRGVDVISIGDDGSMSSAYNIPVPTKSTIAVTTAYATESNGNTVYLYFTPYDGTGLKKDIYVAEDREGQTVAKYKGFDIGGNQYSFQSVTISPQGYLLFKNDEELICCRASSVLMGDIDGNDKITANDAVQILKKVVGTIEFDDRQNLSGDIDGNDKITANDAVQILKYVVKNRVRL